MKAGRDPVDRFFVALNEHDVDGLTSCLDPDFEMVVPQRPARGFRGRDQEVDNMRFLFDRFPDFSVTVLRRAANGSEVWTETVALATGLEVAAVVIWTVDSVSQTITGGRYYSEPVERDAPEIDEFIRSIGAAQIPKTWAAVTPQWMTAAVSGAHPGAEVADVQLITDDLGNNRRARFGLRYRAGSPSGPDRVFVKAEGENRLIHARNGNMFNEADLFASGVPLGVDHPKTYQVLVDRAGLDYAIVMEDVLQRGAEPRDATRPMTVDQVANGARGLARLHSRYWGFSAATHPGLAWIQTWQPTPGYLDPLRERVPAGMARAAAVLPAPIRRSDSDTLVSYVGRFVESLTQPEYTLLHGDPHIGNTYVLPDDDIGFLDWQVARRGNWSLDVGYFLVSALTIEDRRRGEADVVEHYRRALDLSERQRPSRDEAWLRYRASPAYGLAVWLATFGNEVAQSREVCLALCERYAAAFVDLDSIGALAALGV